MTVALFMDNEPHTFEGSPGVLVNVNEALTGRRVGTFALVFPGDGQRQYVTATGQIFSDLDDVLRAIVSRPDQVAA